MARIRTIKPNHVNDKELAKITLGAHLMWILSWCFSDDEGVIENDPILLKSQLFPRRTDVRVEQVEQWIDQLVKARYMIPFTHKGESYLLQRTFSTHQKIDRKQPSKIDSTTIRLLLDDSSETQQPCIVKESIVEESKGEEKKPDKPDPIIVEYPFSINFLNFWKNWKNYKKSQFKFIFKTPETEQAALLDLVKKSSGKEETAIEMIQQSMANGWKGIFELKNYQNGQSNSNNNQQRTGKITGEQLDQAFTAFYSQKEHA
jgi:hypothetical protein